VLLFLGGVWASQPSNWLHSVDHHELVHVNSQHFTTVKEAIGRVPKQHLDKSHFSLQAYGLDFNVILEKNTNLFTNRYKETRVVYRNGVKISEQVHRTAAEVEHCFYHGRLENFNNSYVAINTCKNGFRGTISTGLEKFIIEPSFRHLTAQEHAAHMASAPTDSVYSSHIVVRSSDLQDNVNDDDKPTCGVHDHTELHPVQQHSSHQLLNLGKHNKRHALSAAEWWVEFLVVNDNSRYSALGDDTEVESLAITNAVSAYYSNQANFIVPMSVVMVDQVTFTEDDPWEETLEVGTCDECSAGEVGAADLLNLWHEWRIDPTNNLAAHDNGHLYSHRNFQSSVVGYAGVSAMCQVDTNSGGIDQTTFPTDEQNAAVVAHELGHNLGMYHDSAENECDPSGFVMNAIIVDLPTSFSTCSEDYLIAWEELGRTCMENQPFTQWVDVAECGNGFVEGDEECDCGQDDCAGTRDPCCDGANCVLLPGSDCSADDLCCDEDTCAFQVADFVCREAASDCDIEETCDGNSSTCPTNDFYGQGYPCTHVDYGSGACFSAECVTYNEACAISFASYSGEYEACTHDDDAFTTANECGEIMCKQVGSTTCYNIQQDPVVPVMDGVPCGSLDGEQCSGGACVESVDLNPYNAWVINWLDCYDCEEPQLSTSWCRHVDPSSGVQSLADDHKCSPPFPDDERACLNVSIGCDGSENGNALTDFAANVYDTYDAVGKAEAIRDLVPRICDPDYMLLRPPEGWVPEHESSSTIDEINALVDDYWVCTVMTLLPGLIFMVGALLHAFANCCCNCRNKHCCAKDHKLHGVLGDCCSYIVFASFAVIIFGFTVAGFYFNWLIGEAIVTNEASSVRTLTFNVIDDITDKAELMNVSLTAITNFDPSEANSSLAAANSIFQFGADDVVTAMNDLAIIVNNFGSLVIIGEDEGGYAADDIDLGADCDFCRDSANDIEDAADQMQAADDEIARLQEVTSLFNDSLYTVRTATQGGAITEFHGATVSLLYTMGNYTPALQDYNDGLESFEWGRYTVNFLPFLLCFATTVLAVLFGTPLCKGGTHFERHYCVMVWVMPFFWLLFAIHLPFALVFGDSCDLIYRGENDPGGTLYWDNETSALVFTCLANASLVEAFNLTGTFNFSADDIPTVETDGMFESAEVDSMLADIDSLTYDNITGDLTTAIDVLLGECNTAYNGYHSPPNTLDRVTIPDLDYDLANGQNRQVLLECRNDLMTMIEAETAGQTFVDDLHAQADVLRDEIDLLETNLVAASDHLAASMRLVTSLLDSITAMLGLASCGEIGENWEIFKYTFCDTLTTSVSFEAFSFFMIAVFTVLQFPFTVQLANHRSIDPLLEEDETTVMRPKKTSGKVAPAPKKKSKKKGTGDTVQINARIISKPR
jgi:hypothetical protein